MIVVYDGDGIKAFSTALIFLTGKAIPVKKNGA